MSHEFFTKAARSLACLIALAAFVGVAATPVRAADEWTVALKGAEDKRQLIVSRGDDMSVRFIEANAWTFDLIHYKGIEMVGHYGACGAVINIKASDDPSIYHGWVGTGHGHETVKSIEVLVDGKPWAMKSGESASGQIVTVRKKSNLIVLEHTMEVTFPKGEARMIETNSFKALEDLSKRFNFMYAFMHCNTNHLKNYLAILPDGAEEEGVADKDESKFVFDKDVKAVVFYSPDEQKGALYLYPEVYEGTKRHKTFIWDRPRDNKLYICPKVKGKGHEVGDSFEFQIQFIPFEATADDWQTKGKALMKTATWE